MSQPIKPYVLTNENAPAFWSLGILWMPLATGVLTGNALTMIEQKMNGGGGPPSHLHTQEEGFYVLEGSCTFHAGGQTIEATAGTFLHIPRGTSHSFTVTDDATRVLNFYLPAGFEHIVLSVSMPAQSRTIPAVDAVPMPPPEFVNEVSREYGQRKDLGMPWVDQPGDDNMATTPSQTNPVKPFGSHASDAPAYWHQDILWTMLATAEQTGGVYSVIEELCPEGSGPPAHWHEQDEAFYVLEGEVTLVAGDQKTQVSAGAFVFIPRGTVHSFRMDNGTARLLSFYMPGGFERTVMVLGHPADTRTLPPKGLPMREDQDRAMALLERVGMHPVAIPDFLRQ